MLIPWFITYFALMGFYTSGDVMSAEIPWLQMLSKYGIWVVIIFGIAVGWTLVETATGYILAFIERVEQQLEDSGKKSMSKTQKGLIAIGMLFIAIVLSRFGVIDLIEQGYTFLAYGLFFVYFLPLITIGTYKLINKNKKDKDIENNKEYLI